VSLSQAPRPRTWQVCRSCGDERLETDPGIRCGCGGLLDLRHRAPDLPGDDLKALFKARTGARPDGMASGVWRFRELVLPSVSDDHVVSYPEGNTPLLRRAALARWAGLEDLLLKHEGLNPTGSFKDRGMTVGVTQACRIGATGVACASTGNTSASLAAYAAQAGLPAVVLVPVEGIALGKLAQSLAYGAKTLLVRSNFDRCLRLLDEASGKMGLYLLNSVNPFRVEGQKTIVLEALLQLDWDPPDWIVLPAGNLGNTAAMGKALAEARDWGLISRIPRIAAIQAAGAAPFVRGFSEGFVRRHSVTPETVATAIRIGDPASWDRAVEALRLTNGVAAAVSDEEILEAKSEIDRAGVGCEPASAASLAGVRKLVAEGTIPPGARVMAVITGHLLKDPELLIRTHREPGPAANPPIEIDATLPALEAALRAWGSRVWP
jgi:threonine synthase